MTHSNDHYKYNSFKPTYNMDSVTRDSMDAIIFIYHFYIDYRYAAMTSSLSTHLLDLLLQISSS